MRSLVILLLVAATCHCSPYSEESWVESTPLEQDIIPIASHLEQDQAQTGWLWSGSTPRKEPATSSRKHVSSSSTPNATKADSKQIYFFEFQVSHSRHADTKDKIEVQVWHGDSSTEWSEIGADWKLGEKRSMQRSLSPGVGVASQLRLRTSGTNAVLFESVSVRITGEKWLKFGMEGRFLKCRQSGAKTKTCTMLLEELVRNEDTKLPSGSGQCIVGSAPKALTSNFTSPKMMNEAHEGIVAAQVSYSGFEVWLDCTRNAAYRFEYFGYKDCGKLARHAGFRRDPKFPLDCQQRNGNAYPKTEGVAFDRGHLVPANHLDGDALAIRQSNYMTNILPQAAFMNRGAWLQTEEIIECWRDHETLHILGGAIFDETSKRHAWFQASHGVETPILFWKVVTAKSLFPKDNHRIAWIVPNVETAKRATLDKFLVSIYKLEAVLARYGQAQTFDIPDSEKQHTPKVSWKLAKGCDKSR